MCDHCSCRSFAAISELSLEGEHRELDLLLAGGGRFDRLAYGVTPTPGHRWSWCAPSWAGAWIAP
jgi:hypothetical protein